MNSLQNQLNRGWQIHQARNWQEAERIYRRVLQQAPDNSHAWCYLGIALHDQHKYHDAVDAYRRALALQPKFPIALNNLGNTLRYVHEYDEADRCFQAAIDLKPDYINAYKNRGTLHVWTGKLELGQKYYEQALSINPNEAELHRNLGVIYLLQGRYAEGWREYRWRWQVGDLRRPNIPAPLWDGGSLQGRSILLSAEQGLGDTLHFVRFAAILREQGANPIVYCQPPLLALLQNNPQLGAIYPNNLELDRPVDVQCSLLDVADILGISASNVPADVPYLTPAASLCNYWQRRFPKPTGSFRIGLAWQGNPDHQADAFRSIPLSYFEPLASVSGDAAEGIELLSLQTGFGAEQIANWQGKLPLMQLPADVDKSSGAFMDTAAIMQSLDLVITSDTAIAHLAGAMGIPTWIALGYVPDWRWLLDRSDSPWYPSVRLFRQKQMGDWSSAFTAIRHELASLLAKHS